MSKANADVLAMRLPIPLDAMQTVQEFVERVYGTGDACLKFDGEFMRISAPEAGWSERKRGRGKLPSASNDALRLQYAELKDGVVKLAVHDTEATVLYISEVARQWFELIGGINYVETQLTSSESSEAEFVFTMQKRDGLTPHALREAAEARVDELEAENARLREGASQALEDAAQKIEQCAARTDNRFTEHTVAEAGGVILLREYAANIREAEERR